MPRRYSRAVLLTCCLLLRPAASMIRSRALANNANKHWRQVANQQAHRAKAAPGWTACERKTCQGRGGGLASIFANVKSSGFSCGKSESDFFKTAKREFVKLLPTALSGLDRVIADTTATGLRDNGTPTIRTRAGMAPLTVETAPGGKGPRRANFDDECACDRGGGGKKNAFDLFALAVDPDTGIASRPGRDGPGGFLAGADEKILCFRAQKCVDGAADCEDCTALDYSLAKKPAAGDGEEDAEPDLSKPFVPSVTNKDFRGGIFVACFAAADAAAAGEQAEDGAGAVERVSVGKVRGLLSKADAEVGGTVRISQVVYRGGNKVMDVGDRVVIAGSEHMTGVVTQRHEDGTLDIKDERTQHVLRGVSPTLATPPRRGRNNPAERARKFGVQPKLCDSEMLGTPDAEDDSAPTRGWQRVGDAARRELPCEVLT